MKRLEPVHPGAFLVEEFMKPLEISQNRLARDIGVCPARVNEICQGRRGITADTALRFALYFNTTPELWLNFQKGYELDTARLAEYDALKKMIKPCSKIAAADGVARLNLNVGRA
jgi:addiction module HigA family antidote